MSTLVHSTVIANVVGKMKGTKTCMIYTLFMVVLFFSLTLISSAEQISQEKKTINNVSEYIIVDQNKTGDYNSIQTAVDKAQPGSIIYVKKGEYNEIIDLDKPICLVGEDKESTLINPISKKNKYAICLGAQNVKIKNFTIQNRAPGLYSTAVKVTVSNVEIDNCNIKDTPIGIAIWTSGNIVKNCEIRGCKDEGIAFLGSKYSECNQNQVLNCRFFDNCDGIELQYSSKNVIKDCEFYRNTHTGIDAITSSNDNNKIINCKIKNNRVNGIYLSSSSNNEIIDCEISDNIDGNILSNKYSKNNQVINTNQDESEEENKQYMGKIILRIIEKLKNIKFKQILSPINF